jgi:hypothetical protein
VLTEGHGVPIGVAVEGANRPARKLVRPTIDGIVVDRPEPTAERPQGRCLDKGDDYRVSRPFDDACKTGVGCIARLLAEPAGVDALALL